MLETTAPMLFVFSQKMQNNQIFFTQIYSCPHDAALATTNFEKGSVVSNNTTQNTKTNVKCGVMGVVAARWSETANRLT